MKSVLYFDNFPEAKLALGCVSFPAIIRPYECKTISFVYKVNNYREGINYLYDAFEHTRNSWVAIEQFDDNNQAFHKLRNSLMTLINNKKLKHESISSKYKP